MQVENKVLEIVLVLYNPSGKQISNAVALSEHTNVIAVDNSDNEIQFVPTTKSLKYIKIGNNKGIATAQNIGIKQAINDRADFILFLDQDSSIEKNQIRDLLNVFIKISKRDPQIAALGPLIINKETNKEYKNELRDFSFHKVTTIISSGTLCATDIFNKVGGMEDGLFIDVVDHEWCWRCKEMGYNIYMTREVALQHEVGKKSVKIFNTQFIFSAPFRYYYKYRNSIWMMPRNYVPRQWKYRTCIRLVFDLVLFLISGLFNTNQRNRFKYAFAGIIDGFKFKSHEENSIPLC